MRILTIAAAFTLASLAASSSLAADLTGNYLIEGSCPAPESAYRGTLSIRTTGLFHTLTWQVGNDTILGTALEHDGRLIIEFRFAGGESGLMEMTRVDHAWRGVWAVNGASQLCGETWMPL